MAELSEGEKSWEKMIKPKDGEFTFTQLRTHLGVRSERLHRLAKAAGVRIRRFVRKETYMKKVYKSKWAFLSEEQAKKIIAQYWAEKGAVDERRRKPKPAAPEAPPPPDTP